MRTAPKTSVVVMSGSAAYARDLTRGARSRLSRLRETDTHMHSYTRLLAYAYHAGIIERTVSEREYDYLT
jgi:hypothetical protein